MERVQPEKEEGNGDGPGGVAGGERELVHAVGHEHVTLVDLMKKERLPHLQQWKKGFIFKT